MKQGAEALSDVELLALLLNTGSRGKSVTELANEILNKFESIGGVFSSSREALFSVRGLGLAKVSVLLAVSEISRRLSMKSEQDVEIKSPRDVFDVAGPIFGGRESEHLYLFSLDSRNRLISVDLISIGTVNETLLSPREIIKKALSRNAVGAVVCHNHPSGVVEPSTEDFVSTKRLSEACKLVGLKFIDHVIVTKEEFCSIKSLNNFFEGR